MPIDRRNLTRALTLAAIAAGVGALALLAWGVFSPVSLPPPQRPVAAGDVAASTPSPIPPLESFQPIFDAPWAAAAEPAALSPTTESAQTEPTTPVSAEMTLAGTIGSELAWFRNADGTMELRRVGEQVDGYQIIAIEPGVVRVEKDGQTRQFIKPERPTLLGSP